MTFSILAAFDTVENAFASVLSIFKAEPAVIAQSADAIVTEATPVIDSAAGAGTAAKITSDVNAAVTESQNYLAPLLADASKVNDVLTALKAIQSVAAVAATTAVPATATTAAAPAAS